MKDLADVKCVCVSVCSFCLQVLFPLLTKLLDNISPADVGGMEETRMRACTLLSKVQSNKQHTLTVASKYVICIKIIIT